MANKNMYYMEIKSESDGKKHVLHFDTKEALIKALNYFKDYMVGGGWTFFLSGNTVKKKFWQFYMFDYDSPNEYDPMCDDWDTHIPYDYYDDVRVYWYGKVPTRKHRKVFNKDNYQEAFK